MNCKQGDLAIRVRAHNNALIPVGAIVVVKKWIGPAEVFGADGKLKRVVNDGWAVEYAGSIISPIGKKFGIPDCELRPIRDNDGEDETLQWAPVPTKETP